MATARIQRLVGGVLTNATTVTLSDSAATYGIRRVDTGAVSVAAGAATSNPSTGIYEYDYTALDESLVYEISWKLVTAGEIEYVTDILHPYNLGRTALWETLAQLRRRVGNLTHRMTIGHGADGSGELITAAAVGSFTCERAKHYADTRLAGKIAYIASGLGVGQYRKITANTQSTGVATVTPNWTTTPDATSKVEVWDDDAHPDRINGLIALAVLDVQQHAPVKIRRNPTAINSKRLQLSVPNEFTHIYDIGYLKADGNWKNLDYVPRSDNLKSRDYGWSLVGSTIYMTQVIPSDIALTSIWIHGYTHTNLVMADSEIAQLPSPYIVYLASFFLESGNVRAPSQDPEASNTRGQNWLRHALLNRESMVAKWEPNTVEVGV